MGDKEKIDKLFEQKLGGLEADPGTEAWTEVQNRLEADKRNIRIAYWRWAGTAAAVILAFLGGYFFQLAQQSIHSDSPDKQQIVQPSEPKGNSTTPENIRDDEAYNIASENDPDIDNTPVNKQPLIGGQSDQKETLGNITTNGNSGISSETHNPVFAGASQDQMSNDLVEDSDPATTPAVQYSEIIEQGKNDPESGGKLAQNNPVVSTDKKDSAASKPKFIPVEDPSTRLLTNSELKAKNGQSGPGSVVLSMLASPTFAFRQVNYNNADALTSENIQNENLATSFTGGVGIGYQISDKFEVETGLFINQWEQYNDQYRIDAQNLSSPVTSNGFGGSNNTSAGAVYLGNFDANSQLASVDKNNASALVLLPDLVQDYQFVDVPLNVGYYFFTNDHWGLKIRGGLTSRFLTSSQVSLNYPDGSKEEVDALQLRQYSLQLLAGTGVEYRFNQHLSLSVLPSLQYGLTPVNQHSVVSTYFHQFLIYSGLSYQF